MRRYRYKNAEEITPAVIRLIAQELDVRESDVTLEADLSSFGPDSLALVQLPLALEEEFEIDIPDEDVPTLVTAQAIVTYVDTRLEAATRVRPGMSSDEVKKRLRAITEQYFEVLYACVLPPSNLKPSMARVKGPFADAQRGIERVLGASTMGGLVRVDERAVATALVQLEGALHAMRGLA